MINPTNTLKSFLIFAICIPLALTLGYWVAQPLDKVGMTLIGGVFLVLCTPLVIRFHYPLMILAWNMGAVLFFMPGRMGLGITTILLSSAIAFTHRILDKNVRSIWVPELARPLIVLAMVVFATAEMRGGFGIRSMGGESAGGRHYIELLIGILGFFALTTQRIPREKAQRYISFFILSGTVSVISIFYGRLPSFLNFVFLFIPPTSLQIVDSVFSAFRPLANVAGAVVAYLLARYGIRGMLAPRRGHVLALFAFVSLCGLFSGSRLALVNLAMMFTVMFCLEGLHRTRLSFYLMLALLLGAVIIIPFVTRLPLSVQRTLAVLPIKVDPMAEATAEGSSEWRRQIWRVTIPQIPQYFLLGKGYAISQQDFEFMTDPAFMRGDDVESRAATIAGDYHNGPLSVIIPLGIWGVIAFLWVLFAGFRMLWRNYRYGDTELRVVNTYLLASYIVSVFTFMFIFGGLYSGMVSFTGLLGLSVALNGGVAQVPVPKRFVPPAAKKRQENGILLPGGSMGGPKVSSDGMIRP